MSRVTITELETCEPKEWEPPLEYLGSRDGAGVIGHVVIAAVYILVGALIGSQLVMARSAPVPIAEVRQ